MNTLMHTIKNWFGYASIITLACVIIYITAQQNFRQAANDPQYQIAEDAANAVNHGVDPKLLISLKTSVEISKSLAPYLVIYDVAGNIAASNATLNGNAPKLPGGVLAFVQKSGSDAVTWKPQPGVRQATVIIATTKGHTILAGRSLRKTEERIGMLGQQVLFGWALSLIALIVVAFLQDLLGKQINRNDKLHFNAEA